jgi:hypothetical protein
MKECTSLLNFVSHSNLVNSEKMAVLSDSGLCHEISLQWGLLPEKVGETKDPARAWRLPVGKPTFRDGSI